VKHKILVIDDSQLDLDVIRLLLEETGFSVIGTLDPEVGIAYVRQHRGTISLAIVDFAMPGKNGAKVAKELSAIDPDLQIATYSGDDGTKAVGDTLEAGSQYFIPKDLEPDKKRAIIKMFCKRFEERNRTLVIEPVDQGDLDLIASTGLTGCSRHLVDVAQLIHKYGPEKYTVLITGENGTGKEKVARAIHNFSGRKGPFIPLNCGAIPSELIESELFGHVKGSFSNALKDKVGLVTAANRGTIFLDEIGDLLPQLQVKLLRFLQEGEIRPVGSNETIKVNTRVIAATNVNLDEAILDGRFREDLFYRIQSFRVRLLPLRERREDIKPLVAQFSKIVSQERGCSKEFLEDTVKLMMRYNWPGNIRELELEVKRAMLLAGGDKILPEDIDPKIRAWIEKSEDLNDPNFDYERFKNHQRIRNEEEERNFLARRLKGVRSIRELARDVLKISNSTLQGRLKALGIEFKNANNNGGEREYEAT